MAASDLAEDADDAAEDSSLGGEDRVHLVVLGLQPDVVGLAEEALDGRLLADQGDDDLAVGGLLGGSHDDVVPLEDAGVLHALAADAKDVVAVLSADDIGNLDVLLDVLLGEDRLAGGYLADQRQAFAG